MPKIVVSPKKKGIQQSRGNGFHHLDEDSKGFSKHIVSDTVTIPVVSTSAGAGKLATSGIFIPANAWIERIAIKNVQLQPEENGDGGNLSATEITGWNVSGVSYVLAAAIAVDKDGTLDEVNSYSVTTSSPASDLGALEPNIVGSAQTALVIVYTTTGDGDASETTPAKVEVVVEFCQPQF